VEETPVYDQPALRNLGKIESSTLGEFVTVQTCTYTNLDSS